ncbi:glyceraldehyde-3-phosphate dehydrogenase, type I [Halovivax ruber XH-70]|uniref:glyceraldehyde-3-phosphate dehydrogenase (NAD(P)(+)) (phosphorylating) n=1 Tax=Halovivax ruber (strain DSM 18193 / JCM 13892 / XH-70) TaxID=797302 RepID=L0ID96_HALRX|nr:type I glyceraldehyde-3-phosphate dehydrogenase [Halovivax ruber]AGB15932.1 glyceraldehyde-3-phosphate dehydrogenase, type I [Halovivax ruber XH-70]
MSASTNDSHGESGEPLRIGINGFGRIGRSVLRASLEHDDLDVVAVNDVMDDDDMAYLLQYDSVHGRLDGVFREGDTMYVGSQEVQLCSEPDPSEIPWDDFGASVVLEATGLFRTRDEAAQHLEAGADQVLISAPPKGDEPVPMFVYGVNHETYDGEAIVSNASCTTNSVAPVMQVLDEEFGIDSGLLLTVHAYTGSQGLVDGPLEKRRRGRAAAENIVPTTTGAAIATTEILPQLEGTFDGRAMRVPVPDGSISDLTLNLETDVTEADVADAIRTAADGRLAGVLGYTDDEIVSQDVVGLPIPSYVDLESLMVVDDDMLKILVWYDNEYGFSRQMLDLAAYVASEGDHVATGAAVAH